MNNISTIFSKYHIKTYQKRKNKINLVVIVVNLDTHTHTHTHTQLTGALSSTLIEMTKCIYLQ